MEKIISAFNFIDWTFYAYGRLFYILENLTRTKFCL